MPGTDWWHLNAMGEIRRKPDKGKQIVNGVGAKKRGKQQKAVG